MHPKGAPAFATKSRASRRGFVLAGELLITMTGLCLVIVPLVLAAITSGRETLVPELDGTVKRSKTNLTD